MFGGLAQTIVRFEVLAEGFRVIGSGPWEERERGKTSPACDCLVGV